MKINIVLGHAVPFPPSKGGGIENLYNLLSKEFVRQGNEVVIYSRYEDGLKKEEIDEFGRRHIRIEGYDWKDSNFKNAIDSLKWCWNLRSYIEKADVTLFNTLFSFLILNNRKKYGALISTIHRTPNWKVKLYKNFDRVYGGSKAVINQAREVAPDQKNLMTVYNCMEIQDWGLQEKETTESIKFLYFGRFVRDKGVEQLIKGFEKSLTNFPNNKLVTLGPQDAKGGADEQFFNEMTEYIKDKNLENKIEFMKPIFDKQKLFEELNSADVICVPTIKGETFSMAILEVMSIKKPVLVSDFPPMIEAVEHLKTGYVSKVSDEDSLKDGIEYFSKNKDKISTMGQLAYKKLVNEFTVEKIASNYIEDFKTIMKK